MVELDRNGGRETPVHLGKISQITGISRRYLEQLAIALKSHSLLRGVSGRKGGYLLARPASEITIGEVLTSVIGPINLSVCVVEPELCMRSEFCSCRLIWTLLNRRVNAVLEEFSIADLSNKELLATVREQLIIEFDPDDPEGLPVPSGTSGASPCATAQD
jgi:Rrf2 family cysteine metabolism transcriptional repressor